MKILFSGGGTLGPVTPLIAMKEIIAEGYPDAQFVWIGTKQGPEKELIEKSGISFYSISSGKLRRYVSVLNILDLFFILKGFVQASIQLIKEKPDACISAGGFVSVPVHFAAWFLGIPTWVHQQDVQVGLANKLMARIAKKITTAQERGAQNFGNKKAFLLGNPIRNNIFSGSRERAITRFGLSGNLPVVFATGGGTGSLRVNQLIAESLPYLEGVAEVIHLSGKERPQELVQRAEQQFSFYHHYQFFTDEMKDAYAVADIVISRGGFGTMSELAALKKPSIFIPKPGHQEENVAFLKQGSAAIVMNEQLATGVELADTIRRLLVDEEERKNLGNTMYELLPTAKKDEILRLVKELLQK